MLVAREVINLTTSVSAEKSKMGDYENRSKIVNNQTLPMGPVGDASKGK